MTPKEKILAVANEIGLTMTCEFVPWSLSRNAGEKMPSLNWKVTLSKGDRKLLTTDYMAGSGRCPSYKQGDNTISRSEAVRFECEQGRAAAIHNTGTKFNLLGGKRILPDLADVLHSLVSDADVIDHGSFEEWADNYGYDVDSRAAEKIYRACLDIALTLRSGIGQDKLDALREAGQDY